MPRAAQPPHIKKEAQFLLFTDWGETQANQAPRDVELWPPFAAKNPKDGATMKELKRLINIRLDERLAETVDVADRVYFRHTHRGIELMNSGATLRWETLQGAIVDQDTAARGDNLAKLLALAKNLAWKAPEFLRVRSKVLICLLPASGVPPPATFPATNVLMIERAMDSKSLVGEVLIWLTSLNVQIDDDKMNAPKDLREALEEFLEKYLV